MPSDLTPSQVEALDWLRAVGKATRSTLRRHGYTEATMLALVDKGLAVAEARRSSAAPYMFTIYRPTGGEG